MCRRRRVAVADRVGWAPAPRTDFARFSGLPARLGIAGVALMVTRRRRLRRGDNITGATRAATGGSATLAAAMWTFVVVHAIVSPALERRARNTGRSSILAAR